MLCPACSTQIPDGNQFCGACGSSADPKFAPTQASVGGTGSTHTPTSAPSIDEARFLPGAIVAGRYRIAGLLGRGGMGEVYRADDLKLGQPVALKFLPAALAEDQGRLNRFLHEVRIARQVSHPNVCRVYDVGEAEGHHYLSMEYVDGEDLATLLRRIGRLPEDKAVQIARQLCAGLAAAHELGIVHRDIKPANVMIDGRGRARLTDFGLAGLAEAIEGDEVRAGTPTYMAPEQLAGDEVTIRSDIYALGLVLYELFTGKKAFHAKTAAELSQLQQSTTPTRPSSLVQGMDPAVERVIFLCLEKDPTERPATALAVSAALPGGDPLAAALAAGETPSPEMVAAAGPQGGLRPGWAVGLAVGVVVAFILLLIPSREVWIFDRLPFVKSYAALQENAREVARQLGYDETPTDTASWFELDFLEYVQLLREHGVAGQTERLSQPGQFVVEFVQRQDRGAITPLSLSGRVNWDLPPPDAGDVSIRLDLQGRLRELRVTPPRSDPDPESASELDEPAEDAGAGAEPPAPPVEDDEPDWRGVFGVAGLDIDAFESQSPRIVPPTYADARRAWSGVLPGEHERPVRIEAASYRGRPVFFETIVSSSPNWSAVDATSPEIPTGVIVALIVVMLSLLAVIVGGALFLALRNLRIGRGDRKGAIRLAAAVFLLRMLHWGLAADHVASPSELLALTIAVCGAVTLGALAWAVYVAFEPYVRKLWPESIVSWTRLLGGKLRDPLIGRDIVVGCSVSQGLSLLFVAVYWAFMQLDYIGVFPDQGALVMIRGGRFALGSMFSVVLQQLGGGLGFLLLFLLLRILLRRTWLAAAAMCVVLCGFNALQFIAIGGAKAAPLGLLLGILSPLVLIVLLVRYGLVALLAAQIFGGFIQSAPTTLNVSAPYFGTGLLVALVGLAFLLYGLRISLGGRAVLHDAILDR